MTNLAQNDWKKSYKFFVQASRAITKIATCLWIHLGYSGRFLVPHVMCQNIANTLRLLSCTVSYIVVTVHRPYGQASECNLIFFLFSKKTGRAPHRAGSISENMLVAGWDGEIRLKTKWYYLSLLLIKMTPQNFVCIIPTWDVHNICARYSRKMQYVLATGLLDVHIQFHQNKCCICKDTIL